MDRGPLILLALILMMAWLSASVCCQSWGHGNKNRVLLSDIQTLTLHRDKMTTGRRNRPIPQLSCRGGSAGCTAFTPNVVQCYNRGSDGMDVQWECKCDMSKDFSFGQIEVVCEGYDSPDDPTILKGSCGLEYYLELTNEGKAHGSGSYSSNAQYHRTKDTAKNPWYINWIFLAAVGFFVYYLYKSCIRQNQFSPTNSDDPHSGPSTRRTGRSGPPPPYPGYSDHASFPGSSDHCAGGAQQQAPPAAGGRGPGFWSGIGAGAGLGYLMGRRNTGYGNGGGSMFGNMFGGGGGAGTDYSRGPAYNPSYGGGGSSSYSSGSSSSGTREASGFGGTRRR
ncbi:putative Store-operated calcium entry-associated regulatory factor [Hypsibius exemplaris]|uniref:Store-operated calcium entry-associated regulatory factor n=1 Tax=Hypsibius exemplaris TaxID=2072580 RepID=A0A1W0W8B3_HYPEX|nr:putative Store-operated calcium entry-associated regulatory factor [Hypsibius exemplaris]